MVERSLEDLLREATVRVIGPRPGAGFFVAPGLVLTCVHVVGREGPVEVLGRPAERIDLLCDGGRPIPALDEDYPDVAVVRVDIEDHPCVALDEAWPELGDTFQTYGYPREGGSAELLTPATLDYRGAKGPDVTRFVDLKSDTVKPGMSGGALLNLRSGAVCGVVVATRNAASADGGLAVPWAVVAARLPEVAEASRQFHEGDRRWFDAVRARQRLIEAATQPAVTADRYYRAHVERLIRDYQPVFGGRAVQLAALDAFLEQDRPYALIHEPIGRGKTALLVHWVSEVESRRRWSVVFVPISRRYGTAEASVGLAMLAQELAEFHGGPLEEAHSADDFRPQVFSYLDREPPPGTRLLVVIDGLEETVGWEVRGDLFPPVPNARVKVIAASRQVARRDRGDWISALGWREDQVYAIALPALDRDGIADVLRRSPEGVPALADDEALLGEIVRISQGDPLTVRILVEDLWYGRIEPTRLQLLPEGSERYFQGWLEEVAEKSADSEAAYTLLGLCSAAFGPLTSEDLAALAPDALRRKVDLSRATKDLARFLIGDGSEESGYDLSHPRFKELYLDQALGREERSELRQRFVRWGEAWYLDRSQALSAYLRRFWIAHLDQAAEWDTARKVLTEIVPAGRHRYCQPWAEARYGSEKSWAGYLGDLELLWRHSEEAGDLGTAFRCALLTGTTRSLSARVLPGQLVQLAKIETPAGSSSAAAALENVRQIPDPGQQAHTLAVLARQVDDLPGELALEIARAIPPADGRAEALAAVAHLLPDQEPTILAEALDAAKQATGLARGSSLAALAPMLPDDLVEEAVAEAQKDVGPGSLRALALASLLPRLPKRRQAAVRAEISEAMWRSSPGDYIAVHAQLARALPKREAAAALEKAKAVARQMPFGWDKSEALARLAPLLPRGEQDAVLQEALAAARQPDTRGTLRGLSLARIAGLLPEDEQADVLAEALAEIRQALGARSSARVAEAIAWIRDHPVALLYSLDEALAGPRSTSSDADTYYAVQALLGMARLLPDDLLDEALAAARQIPDRYRRAPVLTALAPRLPEEQQAGVVEEALGAASFIGDVEARASALTALSLYLPRGPQAEVLQEAHAAAYEALAVETNIDDYFERVQPLAVVAQEILAVAEALLATVGTTEDFDDRVARLQAENLVAAARRYIKERLPECVEEGLLVARASLDESEREPSDAPVINEAVAEARSISDGSRRAWILAALAPLLPEPEQATILDEAIGAARISNDEAERARAEGLAVLASLVAEEARVFVLKDAMRTALKIRAPHVRAAALTSLAPILEEDLVEEALAELQQLSDEPRDQRIRSKALVAVALQLPEDRRAAVLKEALAAASNAADPYERAEAFAAVAAHLRDAERAAVLKKACAEAQKLDSFQNLHAKALVAIARQLSGDRQARVVHDARDTARNEPSARWRSEALAAVVPLLPDPEQAAVLKEALAAARSAGDHVDRVEALVAVAPLLPGGEKAVVLKEALAAARQVEEHSTRLPRFNALALVAALLPVAEQGAVLEEALVAARKQDLYGLVRADALITLDPLMPTELLAEALTEARDIPDVDDFFAAMSVLVPRFTEACLRARDDALLVREWQRTVRELSISGRGRLLHALPLLASCAAALAETETLGEIAAATIQTSRCWP